MATLHLLGRPGGRFAAKRVAVSFIIRPGSQLAVRKVKTGSDRLAFLSFARADGHPDFRFKLVGQRSLEEADDELSRAVRELAERCSLESGLLYLCVIVLSVFSLSTCPTASFRERLCTFVVHLRETECIGQA